MISRSLYALEAAVRYVKDRPQILFGLLLLVILPLIFLYTSNQFLEVGRANTQTLVYQRIGLLNDVFASLAAGTNFDANQLQQEIMSTADLNSDITKFRVVIEQNGELIPIAALNELVLGVPEADRTLYDKAFGEPTGITFPFVTAEGRDLIQSFRAVKVDGALRAYIFIESDQTDLNQLLERRERGAYTTLAFLYLVLVALVVWLYKLTDYQQLYREVAEANKAKDRFANMVAHELRAPLTAIRGYASMLQESLENETQRTHAKRINQSAERLVLIVNDLLDVARLQSGKLTVAKETVDVTEVVRAVIDELYPVAMEKRISLEYEGRDAAQTVLGDQKRLHQVFTNLVSNAIKYTKEGTIEIALSATKTAVEVRIKDTGMGISAEDQKKLFAPFFRVASDDVKNITGTGLGMWITKQLIDLMGATIGVESIKGVGTHIVLTLPSS